MKNKFKNTVASVLMAGSLFATIPVRADTLGGAMQIIGSTIGRLMFLMQKPPYMIHAGVNFDPIQLAAEWAVLNAMKRVTYEWPPMQDEYTKAGQNNEDDKEISNPTSKEEALPFEISSLTAVGLEALDLKGFEPLVNGRPIVIEDMSKMQVTSAGGAQLKSAETSDKVLAEIVQKQDQNYRLLSSAGVARAELALKSTYQASASARGGQASTEPQAPDNEVQQEAEEQFSEQQDLVKLPAGITSIAYAMRVQTLMNLELAQRINLSNALQGNILSIEAARELKNAGTRRNN